MIAAGFAFFNREAPGVPRHLWIVLSDPGQDAEAIVIANLSTKPGPDNPGCLVAPGAHPGVSRPSYLRSERARVVSATDLERLAEQRLIVPTAQAPEALLRKLRTALANSPHAPIGARRILRQQRID